MRVLLDECVNPRLTAVFAGHEVSTVLQMGWRGIGNGKLLALAEANYFAVLVTIDTDIEYEQNVATRKPGFVVMHVPDNNMKFYEPIFRQIREAAEAVKPGQVIHVVSPHLRGAG